MYKRQLYNLIKEGYGVDVSVYTDLPERFSQVKDEMLKEKGIPRIEGAVETIKYLYDKGYEMAVASSSSQDYIESQMKTLGIDKCFKQMCIRDSLKGTLQEFAKELFGPDTKTKFRPHHFPFTEPSAEMDVSCFKCGGKGCRFCKGEGWIEILGCGMVHPHVLEMCGIDPEKYQGFAFGVGLERIALLKYEIDDMRLLYENDDRFLNQF